MCKRGLCCCPSVCPSVTLVYCILTADDIVKLLSRPGSPVILVFWPQRQYPIPRGTFSRGTKYMRGGENLRFSTEISVYLGNGTRLALGCYRAFIGSHRCQIDLCRFQWPWVTLKSKMWGVKFWGGSRYHIIRPRRSKFSRITHVGEDRISTGPSHCSQ